MLNINYGHNKKLMEKCGKLQEYAVFIAAIRKFQETKADLTTALNLAIEDCIQNGILPEILKKERRIIMGFILSEFDEEAYAKVIREDGFEEGFISGQQKLLDLTSKLLAQKRYDDLERSTKDKDFLESLYKEFDLK